MQIKALNHEQAHYYLHIGRENLGGTEQESLKRHLSECGACQSYATELSALQSTLSRVMHAQWDAVPPSVIADNEIQSRIRGKIVQKRVLNLTGSLASGAIVLGLVVLVAWFFQFPKLLPVTTGAAPVPTRVNQTFGNSITLLGFGLNQDHFVVGDTLAVTLYWQARVATQASYAVFLHLQDENDRLLVQSDALPVNGTRPTTSWKPDEVIEDRHEIKLPNSLAPGKYKLIVGLYDPNTGGRLNTGEGKDALTLATVGVSSVAATSTSSPTPVSAVFPTDIYPPPVPVAPGVIISPMATSCPDPDGLEQTQELPASAVNEVFRSLASGDLDTMRRVTDLAYWPYLPDHGVGTARQFSEDMLEKPQPASKSPYADLVGNACGRKTLELSWWVKACPGTCSDPNVARASDLMAHFYLIRRAGHWLVWAVR